MFWLRRLAVTMPAWVVIPSIWAQQSPTVDLGRVEITSGRDNDQQQRRESIVSKIVIGREEIERQGESTVGEILKRMPGISMDGAPGRGGAIRMRGLSQGYTQILLDGQRVPPGFSIESITPEMVERIEIYRAPTAETGAQAIAGTINIITREGHRGMPSELKIGSSWQGGYFAPTALLVQYHDAQDWSANYTLSANRYAAPDHAETEITNQNGGVATNRLRISDSHYIREGVNASARLQFKGDPGESLTLMPFALISQGVTPGQLQFSQTQMPGASGSDSATNQSDNRFAMMRLNGQWRRRLSSDSNMEWKFNLGGWDSHSGFQQIPTGGLLPSLTENADTQDRSLSGGGKYTHVLGGGHQWVSGVEVEGVRRSQLAAANYYATGSADLRASSLRDALYSQDEWQLTPNWGVHVGARYEQLTTEGDTPAGHVVNRNQVFTPLLHAVWRPEPESRDQVRMSLTRGFKSPGMASLLARRVAARDGNSVTNPDTQGNPNLQPEVSNGVDVAVEHYLPNGGVLSANVFYRHVHNLVRNVTTQDTNGLWLSTPQNINEAETQGVELEAKFRLDQWLPDAPAVETRSNVSFFHSRVLSVPGPDNRLDQQPSMTANLGADYRMRSWPLTIGGNLNCNPGYTTRLSDVQWTSVSQKRVLEMYGLWRVDASTSWRLTLSNLDPRNYNTSNVYNSASLYENSQTQNRTWTNVQIRLEKKL